MSASSSLSRLEFVLSSAEAQDQQFNSGSSGSSGNGIASSLSGLVPSWMGGAKDSKVLPAPAGGSSSSASSTSAQASALASSAAASASAAASKVGHQTSEWFRELSSKVQGKEHVPNPAPALASSNPDIEEGSTLLPSADPGGASSSIAAQFSSEFSALTTLSWKNRLIAFGMCMTAGCLMMGLAFMYLSLVFVGAPAKFALSYALANVFLLAATLFLQGPSKQLAQMFGAQRIVVSGVYLGSLVLLFYVSWQFRSFFIVLPVLIVQVVSLIAYISSYIPFGQGMLKRICSWTLGRQLSFLSA